MPNKTFTVGSVSSPVDINVTGTLTAPTPTSGSGNTQVATKGYVDTAISNAENPPEVFTVTLTLNVEYAPPRYIGDKTYSEIQAAITAGKLVQVRNGSLTYYYVGNDIINNTLLLFVSPLYVTPYTNIQAPALELFTLSSSNLWTSMGAIGQARITTSGILKGDGSGNVSAAVAGTDYVASPEVFWATYNSTTFAQVKAAVDTGATIVATKYLGTIAFMNTYIPNSNTATFVAYGTTPTPYNPVILEITLENNTWSIATLVLAQGNITGIVQPEKGGTGQTSLQATRNAMGLGNTTGALPVANGGTGTTTLTSGAVLIGNGTSAITTRAIKNNTAANQALAGNDYLITDNTLRYHSNRTSGAAYSDSNYTIYMFRGQALNATDTNPVYNGQISWTYS